MDDADRAQGLSDREVEARLAMVRRANASAVAGDERPALRTCVDCPDPIDAARLAAQPGAQRCTLCQAEAEGRARARLGAAA